MSHVVRIFYLISIFRILSEETRECFGRSCHFPFYLGQFLLWGRSVDSAMHIIMRVGLTLPVNIDEALRLIY